VRILLTNDDGYHAPGLAVLERLARCFSDDITIVAPAEEQSGKGRSLTLTEPLRVKQFDDKRYAVGGTPTDAVMFALANVMRDAKPDLILSGVNRGGNLGEDVFYSGTIGAAMEGALAGIRSIAISQRYGAEAPGHDVSFDTAEAWGERVLAPLIAAPVDPRIVVNVNFPPIPPAEVKGVRIVHQGLRDYGRVKVIERTDPRGFAYYWMGLGRVEHTPTADTDLEAIERGFITVTPLQMDLTHRDSLAMLEKAYQ
jgi:5'-nucleotidase